MRYTSAEINACAERAPGAGVVARPPVLGASGRVELGSALIERAREMAVSDYTQEAAGEFSGDSVRDHIIPRWIDPAELFPVQALRQLGLAVSASRPPHLYATCGVDPHVDSMDGLSVCLVLYSDGFSFRQRRFKLKLATGDWFIFDDAIAHSVDESKGATSLLVLTVPVESVEPSVV